MDQDVRIGVLENGLTYYIRPNTAPGGRAELRLAVNAGSALEDPDQSGVAHFVEHMLFNGTERYPSNELIAVLEAFGTEFGPDVNAYTSYDETVYELSVPTDEIELIQLGFDVLREWAGNATIDPAEVDAETGVVVEEWRIRDQGIGGRIGDLYDELLTTGTALEGREPIGDVDAIANMTPELARRFYDDWYRPDLMAIVAVGDFDSDFVERLIKEEFSDLSMPESPRARPDVAIPNNTQPEYRRLEDPELPSAYVELVYAGPATPSLSFGDLRRSLAYDLAAAMLDTRFAEDVSRGTVPYLTAYASTTPLARDLDTPGLLAEAPAEELEASFEALVVELQRVREDGFSPAELDRAVATFRAGLTQAYAGRDTTQDAEYAAEYVSHFLASAPILSWDDLLDIQGALLDDMTVNYVSGVYVEALAARAPEIVVVGPEADRDLLPDEATLTALLQQVAAGPVAPRVDTTRVVDSLMEPERAAEAVETRTNAQLDSESVVFGNGVTVTLKTTEIADNQVIVEARSPGGTSVFADDQLAAVFVAPEVVTSSGVGPVDQVELDRLLADRFVSLQFSAEETFESITGSSSTEDAEILFQLIFQYLTAPRVEASALDSFLAELEPFAADPGQIPAIASSIELLEARYGNNRRYQVLPSVAELERLEPETVVQAFEQLFDNAGDLTVAIVGDFDLDTMKTLVGQYFGNLPGDGEPDVWVDHAPAPPAGVVERTASAGRDPQGTATVLVSAQISSSEARDIRLDILENVLSSRLRNQLREALGATYSPLTLITAVREPDALVETLIEVSGDPEGLDIIVDEIQRVLADIVTNGLTDAEVNTAREQVRRSLELVSNGFWVDQMLFAEAEQGTAVLTVNERVGVAAGTSRAELESLADLVLLPDQFIVVKVGPAAP